MYPKFIFISFFLLFIIKSSFAVSSLDGRYDGESERILIKTKIDRHIIQLKEKVSNALRIVRNSISEFSIEMRDQRYKWLWLGIILIGLGVYTAFLSLLLIVIGYLFLEATYLYVAAQVTLIIGIILASLGIISSIIFIVKLIANRKRRSK